MEEKDLKKELTVIKQKAGELVVKDKESFELVSKYIIHLKEVRKNIVEYWKEKKDMDYRAWKKTCALESEMLDPVDAVIKSKTNETNKYSTEQRRLAVEAQRLADEEREKEEQKEREKLEKRADKAEESGKTEKAEALREKAAEVYIPPTIIRPEIEKTTKTEAGTISGKEDVELIVNDPAKIIQAVAKGILPITVVKIQEAELKKYVKAMKWKNLDGCNIEWVTKNSFRKGAA